MASYKDLNREIKGYVEVKYNISEETPILSLFYDNGNKTYEIDSAEFTTSLQNIYYTSRKSNKYAILEENYTSLDGSFLLFDKVNQDSGFISDKTINEYIEYGDTHGGDNTQICLEIGSQENLIETDINGLTIYAKYNKITSCHATLYDSEFNIVEERNITDDNSPLLLIFANSLKDKFIYIDHITFENPDRRIMIDHIDIGMSYVYEDNELIEFSVIEEVDKLVQKTPANELTVTIGDYDKLYDPLNLTGITKYLTENATFIPYIGIANDNGKIEYTKMGTFYYDSIDYQDGEVTITAYSMMNKLKVPFTNKTKTFPTFQVGENKMNTYLSSEYPQLNINFPYYNEKTEEGLANNILTTTMYKNTELLAFLKDISFGIGRIFYIDRDDVLQFINVDKTIKEVLTLNEMGDKPKYVKKDKINVIVAKIENRSRSDSSYTSMDETKANINFRVSENPQYLLIESQSGNLGEIIESNTTYSNLNSVEYLTCVDMKPNYFCFLKAIGEIGNVATITLKGYKYSQSSVNTSQEYKIYANDYNGERENSIEVNNNLYAAATKLDKGFKKILDNASSYEVSLNYNGNPNIKAGDYIEIETDYGFIPVFVQKHQLTYDGGLSGSIEGVE